MPNGTYQLGQLGGRFRPRPQIGFGQLPANVPPGVPLGVPPSEEEIDALDRYRQLMEEPVPELPRREQYQPGRVTRILAPSLAALAQITGAMSPEQAQAALQDITEGPYRRAMERAGLTREEQERKLKQAGTLAELEIRRKQLKTQQKQADTMAKQEERLGRPKAPEPKIVTFDDFDEETQQHYIVSWDAATNKFIGRIPVGKAPLTEGERAFSDAYKDWLEVKGKQKSTQTRYEFRTEVWPGLQRRQVNFQQKTGTIDGKPAVVNYDPSTGKSFDASGKDVTVQFKPKAEDETAAELRQVRLELMKTQLANAKKSGDMTSADWRGILANVRMMASDIFGPYSGDLEEAAKALGTTMAEINAGIKEKPFIQPAPTESGKLPPGWTP